MSSARRVLVLTLVVAAVLAVIHWRSRPEPPPIGHPTAVLAASPAVQASGSSNSGGDVPSFSTAPSSHPLTGRKLAVAWLRGYLTRSSRSDERWESAIADLSTPEPSQTARSPSVCASPAPGPERGPRCRSPKRAGVEGHLGSSVLQTGVAYPEEPLGAHPLHQ